MISAIDWSQTPKQFLIWAFICCASAAPSFVCAMVLHDQPLQVAAVSTGIMIFIIAYALAGSAHAVRRLRRRNKALRISLRAGYITRVLFSAMYPVSLIADGYVGLVSLSIVQGFMTGDFSPDGYDNNSHQAGFMKILATTLVHGVVVNVALFIYMSILYCFARLVLPTRLPEGLCEHCGYDLRASPDTCPECGKPVSAKDAA